MDNKKNDHYYALKIHDDLTFIVKHTQNIDEEELANNELLLDSMMFRLIQISENAKKLSDVYKENHPSIPWIAIYGLRNRIVHDYGNVDIGIIYTTLITDIPNLLEILESTDDIRSIR
ncbi:MAG: DUF86 domain-containing protein [Lachnospiraceae bacterium]|nr:DUF86 domain-containing protein [Lachnospiraceae bacterium]